MAVIETGLGGRLDATNVLTPDVTVTTDIDLDHMEILGPTIDLIAIEKAGIIKPEVPHVIGQLVPEARKVMTRVCRERKAPLVRLTKSDFAVVKERDRLDFADRDLKLRNVTPSLPGEHQLRNCALALKILGVLRQRGYNISDSAIRTGLAHVDWPGRFQIVKRQGKPTLVLDVAHNASGAAVVARTFKKAFPGRKAYLVLGLVKRKQHQRIIDSFAPLTREYWLTPLKTSRSTDIKEMAAELDWHNLPVNTRASLTTCWRGVTKRLEPDDIVMVVGSHYLIGEFLRLQLKT